MSLTQILNISESLEINDHRFVGQVVSRNQKITTSEQLTIVPFQFTLRPMNFLLYSQNRDLLANLRYYDKALTQYLNFSDTGWISYIGYQGDMTPIELAACQFIPSINKTLVVGLLPAGMSSTEYIVRAGDFLQYGLYTYIATQDVQRGIGATVDVPIHRNIIETYSTPLSAVIGQYGTTVSMGGDVYTGVTFPVILREYPTYTLSPIANDSYIQWAGSFKAFEAAL